MWVDANISCSLMEADRCSLKYDPTFLQIKVFIVFTAANQSGSCETIICQTFRRLAASNAAEQDSSFPS